MRRGDFQRDLGMVTESRLHGICQYSANQSVRHDGLPAKSNVNSAFQDGFLAKHPTTGNAIASPYVSMLQQFTKQANQSWYQIYQIVKENCSTEYSGPNPQDDVMERLLTARRGALMAKPHKHIEIGAEYGRLTVLSEAPKDSFGHIRWNVRCRCGTEYIVLTSFLSSLIASALSAIKVSLPAGHPFLLLGTHLTAGRYLRKSAKPKPVPFCIVVNASTAEIPASKHVVLWLIPKASAVSSANPIISFRLTEIPPQAYYHVGLNFKLIPS